MNNWFKEFSQRLVWASRAFVADGANPVIKLENGISLDLSQNKIILEGDLAIHVTGNMSLTSDGEMTVRGFGKHSHTTQTALPTPEHYVDRYF